MTYDMTCVHARMKMLFALDFLIKKKVKIKAFICGWLLVGVYVYYIIRRGSPKRRQNFCVTVVVSHGAYETILAVAYHLDPVVAPGCFVGSRWASCRARNRAAPPFYAQVRAGRVEVN